MKKLVFATLLALTACGYSHRNSEMTGQVKKLLNTTPILCANRTDVDVSLGVVRNGVGSMSSEDVIATVANASVLAVLKQAADTGAIVKVTYDTARMNFCWEDKEIVGAEIVK